MPFGAQSRVLFWSKLQKKSSSGDVRSFGIWQKVGCQGLQVFPRLLVFVFVPRFSQKAMARLSFKGIDYILLDRIHKILGDAFGSTHEGSSRE